MDKIDISAIVVGFNESSLLPNCFQSIAFCKEINYFDLESSDNSVEIAATVFILKKNNHNLFITNLWKEASFNNRNLIDNKPSVIANDIHFKAHRNDQSIFSIIRKQYGTILLADETWKVSANNQWDENYPLQARRLRNISKFDVLLYLLNIKKLLS